MAGVDCEHSTVSQNYAHKPAANSLITSMTTHSLSQLQIEPTTVCPTVEDGLK